MKKQKVLPKSFFVSLSSYSWQFQKQLMTIFEMHFGF